MVVPMRVRIVKAEERRAVGRFEARKVRRRGGMRVDAASNEEKGQLPPGTMSRR